MSERSRMLRWLRAQRHRYVECGECGARVEPRWLDVAEVGGEFVALSVVDCGCGRQCISVQGPADLVADFARAMEGEYDSVSVIEVPAMPPHAH